MKIIQAQTGAPVVPVPARGVIFVDPALNHETVVKLIRRSMPLAHEDSIRHWVEAVLPTATPLSPTVCYEQIKETRRRTARHRAPERTLGERIQDASLRWASMTAAAVIGLIIAPALTGGGAQPAAAQQAWDNPIFSAIQTGSDWDCSGTDSADLVAKCVASDGAVMHVEAWVGPDSITFTFAYVDPVTGKKQRNEMKVFSTADGLASWRKTSLGSDKSLFPHLIMGERWAVYGSDKPRISRWAKGLDADVVLPADMTQAAYAMGLIPQPGPEAGPVNSRELRHVPTVLRQTVARIVSGDDTLPKSQLTPLDPVATIVVPLPKPPATAPATETQAPAPAPAPVVEAPAPAPAPVAPAPAAPAPVVEAPAPAPAPTQPAPAPAPIVEAPAPAPAEEVQRPPAPPAVEQPAYGSAPVIYPPEVAPDPLTDRIIVPEAESTPTHDDIEQEREAARAWFDLQPAA